MKLVGLTGGIGSGKSTVARVFECMGIPVFRSDLAGRRVLDEDPDVKAAVIKLLGEEVYRDGKADRHAIASVVFAEADKLKALNAIVHPAVASLTRNWLDQQQGAAYCMKEAAILFESGAHKDCDEVVCVIADDALRIQRVTDRDGGDASDVRARMQRQMPQDEIARLSSYVIENSGQSSVIQQVMRIHSALIN